MIILAPEPGQMMAGYPAFNVNTLKGGTRCAATESASETARDTREKSNGWTTIKRRAAQGAGNTRTALTRPLPIYPEGGQAVQKPMSSSYATPLGRAVTNAVLPVTNLTVSVVAL